MDVIAPRVNGFCPGKALRCFGGLSPTKAVSRNHHRFTQIPRARLIRTSVPATKRIIRSRTMRCSSFPSLGRVGRASRLPHSVAAAIALLHAFPDPRTGTRWQARRPPYFIRPCGLLAEPRCRPRLCGGRIALDTPLTIPESGWDINPAPCPAPRPLISYPGGACRESRSP